MKFLEILSRLAMNIKKILKLMLKEIKSKVNRRGGEVFFDFLKQMI